MINLSTNKQLNLILPSSNKALAEAIKSASPQELQSLSQDKDLKSIMNSLLKQSSQSANSDNELLNLLKNNPTLKSLGSVSGTIKDLLNAIKSEKNPLPTEKLLNNFLVDIKDLSEPILKEKIQNSGVFLESKLKNPAANVKEIMVNDLKAILAQANVEIAKSDHPNKNELLKQIDKLTLQIDYHQLVSHLSNSTSLYVPFEWDKMKEGQINIRKDKEDKFYVDIDLKLEEYGELNVKLSLYEENQLNIQIYSDNSEFKELVKENIPSLRSSLIENNVTPREIRLLDSKTPKVASPYMSDAKRINIGFEVKA